MSLDSHDALNYSRGYETTGQTRNTMSPPVTGSNQQYRNSQMGQANTYVNGLVRRSGRIDPSTTALNQYYAQAAPEFAGYQNAREQFDLNLGQIAANYDMQSRYANEDYAANMQGIGLDRSALGLERAGIQDRNAYLDQLLGFANRQLAQQMAGFNVDQRESGQTKARDTFQHQSQMTSRGTWNNPMQALGLGWIEDDFTNRESRIDLGRQGAQLGLERETASIGDQRKANQRAGEELTLRSKRLGVEESKYRTALDRTIQNLGLDQWMSANDVLQGSISNDIQEAALYRQITEQAEQAYTANPQMFSWTEAPRPATPSRRDVARTTRRNANRSPNRSLR